MSLKALLPMLVLLIVGLLVWGRTLGFGFVWDDEYFIVRNPSIRDWHFLPAYFTDVATMADHAKALGFLVFRPIRNISYLLDFKAVGLAPTWWHLHSVLLHIANTLLLMCVAMKLFKRTDAAGVAAAVFLLHPVQTEAVAWVKCRDDLQACLFVLLATLLWLRWRQQLRIRHMATLAILYLLACLSKIQTLVLPALLLAYEIWVPHERPQTHDAAAGAPAGRHLASVPALLAMAAVGPACLIWRHAVIGTTRQTDYLAGSLAATMLTMSRAAVRYLELLLWPQRLLADYSGMDASTSLTDLRVVASLAVLAALAVVVLRCRRRFPLATFGFIWIGVSLAPMSNIVPMMQYMAERFLYLPMAGFAITAGAVFATLAPRAMNQPHYRRIALVTGLLLTAMAARSVVRMEVWRNPDTLFTVTVRDTPASTIRPRRNLLKHLVSIGNMARARPLAEELWELQGQDPDVPPHAHAELARYLGLILTRTGDPRKGKQLIRRAITLDPSFATAYIDMGVLCGETGDHKAALDWFRKAIEADPATAMAYYNQGLALEKLGRSEDAERAFRKAIALRAPSPEPYRSLTALLWREGRIQEAVERYKEARRLWPDVAEFAHWEAKGRALIEQARDARKRATSAP